MGVAEIAAATVRKHRTDYSLDGWRCECGHKYHARNVAVEVEDHRLAAAVQAGIEFANVKGAQE